MKKRPNEAIRMPLTQTTNVVQSDFDPIQRIQRMAQLQPDKSAIEDRQIKISYAQLFRSINLRVVEIAGLGVSVGDHIGVIAPNSADTVITFLALWRLGLVYVPLNPDLPTARLLKQVESADLAVVIQCERQTGADTTFGSSCANWPCDSLIPIQIQSYESYCNTEDIPDKTVGQVVEWPSILAAYIIFTSGTTGAPKPVLVSRENCMAHTRSFCDLVDLSYSSRVLQICASSFDISIEEIVPTLCQGSTLVIAPNETKYSPQKLDAFIRSSQVTVINLPTALWSMWLDYLQSHALTLNSELECILIGGEACPPQKAKQWSVIAPSDVTCLNAYGPTETTITVSACALEGDSLEQTTRYTPVGEALKGVELFIDEQADHRTAKGTELLISGDCVSHGYYGNPRATSESFLPHPNACRPGQRCYSSGDSAYFLETGDLVVSGRLDRQVKIRGHRIELGEIEAVLLDSQSVKHALIEHVVEVHDDLSRDFLVAYIVCQDVASSKLIFGQFCRLDKTGLCPTIGQKVNDNLPRYMQPHYYCVLEKLPICTNGKLDRRSLPVFSSVEVDSLTAASDTDSVSGDVISCLQSVLGFVPENNAATFLELGGDSILAMTLSSRLWAIGYDLDVIDILSQSSVLSLCATLKERQSVVADESAQSFPKLKLTEDQRRRIESSHAGQYEFLAPCLDSQQAMLYHSLIGRKTGQYIEQVEGPIGYIDVASFEQAWKMVIKEHDVLRNSFNFAIEGMPLQVVHAEMDCPFSIKVLSKDEDADFDAFLSQYLTKDRACAFDLATAPLFRIALLKRADQSMHLVWTYHHGILDGWSDVLVLDEVFDHYMTLTEQGSSRVAKLELSGLIPTEPKSNYQEFLNWYENQESSACETAWLEYIGANHTLPSLSERMGIEGTESIAHYSLTPEQVERITDLAESASVTVNTIFNFAFGLSLANVMNVTDLVIGAVNALRPREVRNIEYLVGPLLGLSPLRLNFTAGGLVKDYLGELSNQAMAISRYPRVPHAHLMSHFSPGTPRALFDAIMIFENYPPATNPVVNRLRSHTKTNYPLNIIVWPTDGITLEVRFMPEVIDERRVNEVVDGLLHALNVLSPRAIIEDVFAQSKQESITNEHDLGDGVVELSF